MNWCPCGHHRRTRGPRCRDRRRRPTPGGGRHDQDPPAAQRRCSRCVCSALTGACTSPDDASDNATSAGKGEAATTPCAPSGDTAPAKALLACGEHSIVYLETAYASGTGVVIDDDGGDLYVLTNLHVIDPFDAADVTLSDGTSLATLPIVGAEAATDVAVLGPIDGTDADDAALEPLPLEPTEVDKGDDVFVVGYPGTAGADAVDLTITSGLVSVAGSCPTGTRPTSRPTRWSRASGGPMFSAGGALVGITSLALDESFWLALATSDVAASVDRILDDGGDDLLLVPASADDDPAGGATTGTLEFTDDLEAPVLFLPAAGDGPASGTSPWPVRPADSA